MAGIFGEDTFKGFFIKSKMAALPVITSGLAALVKTVFSFFQVSYAIFIMLFSTFKCLIFLEFILVQISSELFACTSHYIIQLFPPESKYPVCPVLILK